MFSFLSEALLGKVKSVLTIASIAIAILATSYGLISKIKADKMEAERNNAVDELQVKNYRNSYISKTN